MLMERSGQSHLLLYGDYWEDKPAVAGSQPSCFSIRMKELEVTESLVDAEILNSARSSGGCSSKLLSCMNQQITFFTKASLQLVSFDCNLKGLDLNLYSPMSYPHDNSPVVSNLG